MTSFGHLCNRFAGAIENIGSGQLVTESLTRSAAPQTARRKKAPAMTKLVSSTCAALALCVGLSFVPAAQAAEGDAMMKKDAMMHKGMMKKPMKHKDHMGGAMMKKDDAAPQQ